MTSTRSTSRTAGHTPGTRTVCSLITTEGATPLRATVRVAGVLDRASAFVAEQVVSGHWSHGRRTVRLDLSAVTAADPLAWNEIIRFGTNADEPTADARWMTIA